MKPPFLLACGLASALIAGGCTFDSSQLRALGPDGGLGGATAGAGGQGGTGASVGSASGNGGASVAGVGGGGTGGTGGQVATATGGAPGTCVPGASALCYCPTGQQGAQICTSAGTFGACVCAGLTIDAGEAGDVDGAATGPPDAPASTNTGTGSQTSTGTGSQTGKQTGTSSISTTATATQTGTSISNCPIAAGQTFEPNPQTTGTFCFITCDAIAGWGCSNMDGRTITVNGTAVTCPPNGAAGGSTLPAKVNGAYTFNVSAGTYGYAEVNWWGTAAACPTTPDAGRSDSAGPPDAPSAVGGSGGSAGAGGMGGTSSTGGTGGAGATGGSGGGGSTATGGAITTCTPVPKSTGGISCPGGFCTVGAYSGYEFILVDPTGKSSVCVAAGSLCGAGTVGAQNPPSYTVWGAGLGFSLSPLTMATTIMPVQLTGTSVTVKLSSLPTNADMRLQVMHYVGATGTTYCAVMTTATQTIPWTSFNTMCWTPASGVALTGPPNTSNIWFQASSRATAGSFDFCVTGLSFQ